MKRLLGLLRKEGFHILRDRRTLFVLLFLPVLQVIMFGYAIRTDVNDVRVAIVDPSPDEMTLRLRGRLGGARVFHTVAVLPNTNALDRLFQRGDAQAAIVFEPRFAERLANGTTAHLLIITDSTEPNTGATIESYARNIVQGFEREIRAREGALQIVPRGRMRFNPTAESKNLFVPGLIAFVLTIISCLMTAITIAREKETGTMETLLVSPLRPWEIIIGKVLPYLVIGFAAVIGVLLEAKLVFRIPIEGSIVLLLAEGMLFILVSLSLGVLISSRTSSQRVAMTGALLGTMLPTMMLSGFIFPIESMPLPLRLLSNIVPAKWFVLIARGIMLKGIGLGYLWQETLILAAMALVLLTLSTRSFSERLE
ncbi:MAG TPA: ABC transporter permease [Thermoanaerobaculia bacterium]|nr:ABC transporter permease [Thermoanaerobaculia bacterium]